MSPREAAKAAVALVGAVGTWGIVAGEDSAYTHVEWYGLVLALATALGVYLVPNAHRALPPIDGNGQPTELGRAEVQTPLGAAVVCLLLLAVVPLL